ncbi:MAG: Smr/MutS family protein [Deferribacteraceae bacterium]|jgi:DNA mismatch repair protein MutS2|nr:Smr/MutS family protein [Deferribacteraceae bacterium]
MGLDLETLEFPLFCSALKKSFISSFSAERLGCFYPKQNLLEIISFQDDLKTLLRLYEKNTPPHLNNDQSFFLLYQKACRDEGPFLSIEPEEYNYIKEHIRQMSALKLFMISKTAAAERLGYYINQIQPDLYMADLIERTLEDNGKIRDNATAELLSLRRRITDVKRRVQSILRNTFSRPDADKFIQEQIVALRNGRYTIPCKTNYSQYISGIVHDRSASGQTVYLEPASCIAINNDLQETIIAESEEIAKITAALLSRFNEGLPVLHRTLAGYSELVFRIELCAFFYKYEITFPEFGSRLLFKGIHHPLLRINKGDQSVPLDLSMSERENLLVISGPNTGGKTAALKSAGLNSLIAMCGLPLFGKRAEVVIFSDIRADIGDKQSLVMDLSTFSSHMTNIRDIISETGEHALILFDELGTGTDPREGAALAIAILEYLSSKNAFVMITTHFSELKAYAFEHDNAVMYAVDFDYESYKPLYRLLEGVAGKSDPIMIAVRLGFPDLVTEKANDFMNNIKSRSEVILEEVHLMKAEAEHIKRELIEREDILRLKEEKVNFGEKELREKLEKKELELLEDTFALLQRGKRLAEERTKDSPEAISQDLESVGEKIKTLKSRRKLITELKAGDMIFLEKYFKNGKILSIDDKNAHIDLDGIKLRINRRELVGHKVEQKQAKNVKITIKETSPEARHELLLVGKRVEEAFDILDKYIDEAQLAGYSKVYIIHGRGSGQLRRAVHDFLRTCGRIKRYNIASTEEGGNAITVVDL